MRHSPPLRRQRLRQGLRHCHGFMATLGLVALLWLSMSMSDVKPFLEVYTVHYQGLDTAQYVVVHHDTTLALQVHSNGFHALQRSIARHKPLRFDVTTWQRQQLSAGGDIQLSASTSALIDDIRRQLPLHGIAGITPLAPTLNVQLSRRQSRTFVPDIDSVKFLFDATCGLSAAPVVTPDSVVLYGSSASLAKITAIRASAQTVGPIHRSGRHRIRLHPVWRQYPDLRIADSYVIVTLPVERYILKTVEVPITFSSDLPVAEAHLYPATVSVDFWTTEEDYAAVGASSFQATATYSSHAANTLPVLITRFPANVRIKQVRPPQVQYPVIKSPPSPPPPPLARASSASPVA